MCISKVRRVPKFLQVKNFRTDHDINFLQTIQKLAHNYSDSITKTWIAWISILTILNVVFEFPGILNTSIQPE